MIEFDTGRLSAREAEALLNALPGDITFIGDNDAILYYNEPRRRLFGRSRAILGTSVQSCHPSESVPAVDQLLRDFKSGAKDGDDAWVTLDGRLIWVRYFAVRDPAGEYLGCLEFAQDVAAARPHAGPTPGP